MKSKRESPIILHEFMTPKEPADSTILNLEMRRSEIFKRKHVMLKNLKKNNKNIKENEINHMLSYE